jgi:hypothetical protein
MKNATIIFLSAITLLSLSCEKAAAVHNPKKYSASGLQFKYPGNWKITEDNQENMIRYTFVETNGDALTIIQIYPSDMAPDIGMFAKDFSNSAKNQTKLKIGESVFNTDTVLPDHKTINERLTMSLLNVDVPHIRIYKRVNFKDKIVFLIGQVSIEDMKIVIDGFNMIFSSLKVTE